MNKVNGSIEKLFQYISISRSLGSIKCLDDPLNGLDVTLKIEYPLKIECYPYLWHPLLKHHLGDATRRVDSILPIINKLMVMKNR